MKAHDGRGHRPWAWCGWWGAPPSGVVRVVGIASSLHNYLDGSFVSKVYQLVLMDFFFLYVSN